MIFFGNSEVSSVFYFQCYVEYFEENNGLVYQGWVMHICI